MNYSYGQPAGRRVYLPHEVREMSGSEMLVFGENLPGIILAGRKPYFLMPECRGKYRPDPEHTMQPTKPGLLKRA